MFHDVVCWHGKIAIQKALAAGWPIKVSLFTKVAISADGLICLPGDGRLLQSHAIEGKTSSSYLPAIHTPEQPLETFHRIK
jgi:hypothetical protein